MRRKEFLCRNLGEDRNSMHTHKFNDGLLMLGIRVQGRWLHFDCGSFCERSSVSSSHFSTKYIPFWVVAYLIMLWWISRSLLDCRKERYRLFISHDRFVLYMICVLVLGCLHRPRISPMICVLERLVLSIGITKKASHITEGAKYKHSCHIYDKYKIYLIPSPCIMRPRSNQQIKIKGFGFG